MNTIGLWEIADAAPTRLEHADVAVEKNLEDWIAHDPSLLEHGLVVVGRQVRLEGGPLDLLALDPQGRWVLIEIKRERLRRDVIAQAIDYASCLHRLDPTLLRESCNSYLAARNESTTLDELLTRRGRSLDTESEGRDIVIYLVGTGIDAGLERMVEFLAERAELALRLVTFSVFEDAQGKMLLAREIHESLTTEPKRAEVRKIEQPSDPEAVLSLADLNGVGGVLRPLYETAMDLGIVARLFAKSIMFAPPANRSRCLFVVWVERRKEPGLAKAYINAEAFEQFYGISESDLAAIQIPSGEVMLDVTKTQVMTDGLRRLLGPHS